MRAKPRLVPLSFTATQTSSYGSVGLPRLVFQRLDRSLRFVKARVEDTTWEEVELAL
jgi:hypothetical protein